MTRSFPTRRRPNRLGQLRQWPNQRRHTEGESTDTDPNHVDLELVLGPSTHECRDDATSTPTYYDEDLGAALKNLCKSSGRTLSTVTVWSVAGCGNAMRAA